MNSITRFFALVFSLIILGCSDADTDDPIVKEESIPELTITISVDNFHMIKTCEGNGTDGKGDLYSTVYINVNANVGADLTEVAKSTEVVHSLGFDEKLNETGIQATATVTPFNGMKLECIFTVKEVDPGSTQISKVYNLDLIYDEAKACWFPLVGASCAEGSESGKSTFNLSYEERMKDDTCDVLIGWTVDIAKN